MPFVHVSPVLPLSYGNGPQPLLLLVSVSDPLRVLSDKSEFSLALCEITWRPLKDACG